MSLIKETIISISSPLTYIFNLSITSGMVPIELKIARVVPLFKAGDKSIFSNYRPISVLPSFSKILEKLVYNRHICLIAPGLPFIGTLLKTTVLTRENSLEPPGDC